MCVAGTMLENHEQKQLYDREPCQFEACGMVVLSLLFGVTQIEIKLVACASRLVRIVAWDDCWMAHVRQTASGMMVG